MHAVAHALPAALLVAAAFAAPAVAEPCRGADVMPTVMTLQRARQATLCLLNRERRAHGLRPTRSDVELRGAAQTYSRAMVRHHFFGHVSPGGSTLLDRVRSAGYPTRGAGWMLGENLAWGSGPLATPVQAMRAWMRSPGHRHNVLTPGFTEVGIGITPGAPVPGPVGMEAATYAMDLGGPGGRR